LHAVGSGGSLLPPGTSRRRRAGELGFQPRWPAPESGVLPLDDSPRPLRLLLLRRLLLRWLRRDAVRRNHVHPNLVVGLVDVEASPTLAAGVGDVNRLHPRLVDDQAAGRPRPPGSRAGVPGPPLPRPP